MCHGLVLHLGNTCTVQKTSVPRALSTKTYNNIVVVGILIHIRIIPTKVVEVVPLQPNAVAAL